MKLQWLLCQFCCPGFCVVHIPLPWNAPRQQLPWSAPSGAVAVLGLAPQHLTCTYFSSGTSHASCTSLGLQVPRDKRRVVKLFASVVVLWGAGRDGKDKNWASRHTSKIMAFFFLAVLTARNVYGSCLRLTQWLVWEPEKLFLLYTLKETHLLCLLV